MSEESIAKMINETFNADLDTTPIEVVEFNQSDIPDEDRMIVESLAGFNRPQSIPISSSSGIQNSGIASDMKRLMMAVADPGNPELINNKPSVALSSVDGKEDMKRILTVFHKTTNDVFRDAKYERELREAMMTESIPNGARIGDWEIRTITVNGRKFYNIGAVGEDRLVVAELSLFEAAQGIVRILNNGGRLNNKEAMQLLTLENEYSRAVEDAIRFKSRMMSNPNDSRVKVFEDRYSEAKYRALSSKEKILKIVN